MHNSIPPLIGDTSTFPTVSEEWGFEVERFNKWTGGWDSHAGIIKDYDDAVNFLDFLRRMRREVPLRLVSVQITKRKILEYEAADFSPRG